MHVRKTSNSDSKKYPPGSFMGRLKEQKIIATLAAFIGGGWLTYEVVHWILVDHYHLPKILKDITIVTFLGALLSTVIWRWFRRAEKRPGNVKVEVLVVPLIILITLVTDLKFIFKMTGIAINMLIIGVVSLCIGIAWVVFKSLQWAASAPEAEKKVEALKPIEEKPISFPEWKKSIVVLPFDNISPEEDQDYFCDGMTEEIITDLSSIHELRVISRSSAMMLKGSKKPVRDIAKELNVQYVLEGSVRKAGNDIRITAQLIDATSDAHLWAEKYSSTLDDVFDIQEKVSRSIVDALRLKISPEEIKRISEKPIDNVQAYECYLRARQEIWRWTEDAFDRALQYLKNGLEIIGENSLLYAGIGEVYYNYVNIGVRQEDYIDKAEECIKRAFELDPDCPRGHYVLGLINQAFRANPRKSVDHLKRALAVDPNDSGVLFWLIAGYSFIGKTNASVPLIDRLLKIDPLDQQSHFGAGLFNLFIGRFDLARKHLHKAYQIEPENPICEIYYGLILIYNKSFKEAYAVMDKSEKTMPEHGIVQIGSIIKYAMQGKKERISQLMTSEFQAYCRRDPFWSLHLAEGYALLDEKEKAFDWLENAINRGLINYQFLNDYDSFLENIRREPRFKKLMKRVKHEWENFEV